MYVYFMYECVWPAPVVNGGVFFPPKNSLLPGTTHFHGRGQKSYWTHSSDDETSSTALSCVSHTSSSRTVERQRTTTKPVPALCAFIVAIILGNKRVPQQHTAGRRSVDGRRVRKPSTEQSKTSDRHRDTKQHQQRQYQHKLNRLRRRCEED